MDEQSKSRVFSLVVSSERNSEPRPKLHLPKFEYTQTHKCEEACLRSILFSFDEAVLKAPNVLDDPAAFVRLAAAHGFPLSNAIQRQRKYENIQQNAMRMLAQQNCLGHRLIALWKRMSPDIASRVSKMKTVQSATNEPFAPGSVRKIRQALAPHRDQLGFEIIRDLNLLENPVEFLAMCKRIGYDGPGSNYDTSSPNDLNTAIGQRLIDTWRIIAIS